MIPDKLKPGDELRVIAPSLSLGIISAEVREIALKNLEGLGFPVTFGENVEVRDAFDSSPAASRLADLHAAFADPQVKGILAAIGGYNCNQLLSQLDYELIRSNPKVFCGYSDITALQNAIYARSGLVTYSGPHFSSFGMRKGLEYTLEHFRRAVVETQPVDVKPTEVWSDDAWYRDQEQRSFMKNAGWVVIHPGQAEGTLIGGNLCTLNLLQGTAYMPSLAGSLLMVEDDHESKAPNFDRDLQSLLHQPGFSEVRGLVIGRFQRESEVDLEKLALMIESKPELRAIPVVANADFGHTTPQLTFPVGGTARLVADEGEVRFTILEH